MTRSFLPNYCSVRIAIIGLMMATNCRAAETGREVFENKCAPCHGVDGKARTPAGRKLGAKDLSQSQLGDADITRQIQEGSKDKRGAEKMPPFKDKLNPGDTAALVAYVKTFRPH